MNFNSMCQWFKQPTTSTQLPPLMNQLSLAMKQSKEPTELGCDGTQQF
jgi:hypothetical protein